MEIVRTFTSVGVVLTTGLMAGLYLAFSVAVMPGLRAVDDPTFVRTMRSINRAILNPAFLVVFLGPLVLGLVAVATQLPDGEDLVEASVGLVLYASTLAITAAVNVPLNNALDAATDAPDDVVRHGFERRWTRWNSLRTVLCVAAFGVGTSAMLDYAGWVLVS